MHAPQLVAHLCRHDVVTTTEEMTLKDAAGLMRKHHVGCLVVVRGTLPRVAGILTDRDIAIVAVARDFDPMTLRVADAMTSPVHTISASSPAISALQAMRRHGVRRLPVTGEFDELAGILSLDDLLTAYAADLGLFAQALRHERQLEQRVRV
jgi:CBS domain-containing protein